jgi:hypothetical protein
MIDIYCKNYPEHIYALYGQIQFSNIPLAGM